MTVKIGVGVHVPIFSVAFVINTKVVHLITADGMKAERFQSKKRKQEMQELKTQHLKSQKK